MLLEIKKQNRNKIIFFAIPSFFACTTFHSFQLFTLKVLFPTFLHNLRLLKKNRNTHGVNLDFLSRQMYLPIFSFLNLGTDATLVSKHPAIKVFPTHILEIMEVMDVCNRHVKGVYDTTYPADSIDLIPIVVYALRYAISPIGSRIDIFATHSAAFRSCVLTHPYRIGINAEPIFGAIYGYSHVLSNFLGKACRQLAPEIELPAANKVRQLILAFIVQTVEQEVLAVKAKRFGCYAKSYDLKVGKISE